MKSIVISLLCIWMLGIGTISSYAQGLYFVSHEEVQNKRTGLELFGENVLSIQDQFDMKFALKYRPGQETYFGYVFRIILNDQYNIDLISRDYSTQNRKLSLVVGDQEYTIALKNNALDPYQWLNVHIMLDLKSGNLHFSIGEQQVDIPLSFPKQIAARISFGANNMTRYSTTDVPPIYVKDIQLYQGGKERYKWTLLEEGNLLDTLRNEKAIAINPVWVQSLHRKWLASNTLYASPAASVCFDQEREILYIVGNEYITKYAIATGKQERIIYADGPLGLLPGNQSLYVGKGNQVFNYFPDQQLLTSFDEKTRTWSKRYTTGQTTAYWHSNKFFSKSDSAIYVLGGYGYFTYKNQLSKISMKDGQWQEVILKESAYTPRYLSSLGVTDKGAYILGGYGNKSGKQELNPHYYYDLLYFDPVKATIRKVANLPMTDEEYIFGNSMVIVGQQFYTLMHTKNVFDTSIRLLGGGLDGTDIKVLEDSIPYKFSDIKSYSDLFFASRSQKLLAVTLFDNGEQTEVKIYSLNFPPQFLDRVSISGSSFMSKGVIFLLLLLSGVIISMAFLWRIRKKIPSRLDTPVKKEMISPLKIEPELHVEPQVVNHIYLFGPFRVFDHMGLEVTRQFTPVLRQLFLSICLYTFSSKKGISSERLYELLWSDKSTKSARNNLLVNMGKLKTLLSDVVGLEISKETGYWAIKLGEDNAYIDYAYFKAVSKNTRLDFREKMMVIADIVQKGSFLEDMNYEWMDEYKSEVSTIVTEVYTGYQEVMDAGNEKEDVQLMIANKIMQFNPMNEEAMYVGCLLMSKSGMHQEARITYESFAQEYLKLYGEAYPISLKEILKRS